MSDELRGRRRRGWGWVGFGEGGVGVEEEVVELVFRFISCIQVVRFRVNLEDNW